MGNTVASANKPPPPPPPPPSPPTAAAAGDDSLASDAARAAAWDAQMRPDVTRNQPALNIEMRAILVDWLCDVARATKMKGATLTLAVLLTDAHLIRVGGVSRPRLQAVGLAALRMADQLHSDAPLSMEMATDVCDNAFTAEELSKLQIAMLESVGDCLLAPTAYTIAHALVRRALCAANKNKPPPSPRVARARATRALDLHACMLALHPDALYGRDGGDLVALGAGLACVALRACADDDGDEAPRTVRRLALELVGASKERVLAEDDRLTAMMRDARASRGGKFQRSVLRMFGEACAD